MTAANTQPEAAIARDLSIPLELILDVTAVLGRRGSGKSNTAIVCVESLIDAGVQVVVVDPKGEWHGLRVPGRGRRGRGFPVVVMGGEESLADITIEEGDGDWAAEALCRVGASVVLMLNHLPSRASERRFMEAFFDRLYRLKATARDRRPLLVVIEEAGLFVPQGAKGGDTKMAGAIQRLARQGRSLGFGVMLVDQRPATVSKEVLTQAGTLFVHQLKAPHDRRAIRDWITANDPDGQCEGFMDSLAGLETGECWVWSCGRETIFKKARIYHRRSADTSATPQPGEIVAAKAEPVPVVELLAEIGRPEREEKSPGPFSPPVGPCTACAAKERQIEQLQLSSRTAWIARDRMAELVVQARSVLDAYRPPKDEPENLPVEPEPASLNGRRARVVSQALSASGGKARMLAALAAHGECSNAKLGVVAGLSSRSGTFSTYISALRAAGLIEGNRRAWRLTRAGRDATREIPALPVGSELRAYWASQLNAGQRRIFDVLVEKAPHALDRGTLAELSGMSGSSGTFSTYCSKLVTLGIAVREHGAIRAADALFE